MTPSLKYLPLTLISALFLSACSDTWFGDDETPPLPGERISILELSKELEPENIAESAQGFVAPSEWDNEFWPQGGGYPNHAMQSLALGGELKQVWRADIGEGSSSRLPLNAQPIVVDGKVFTLDTRARLSAFSMQTGERLWQVNVAPNAEDDPVISGGVSFSGGVLYVTSGYNDVLAANPANGEIYWRKKIDAPSRAAPTIDSGRVFVTSLNNTLTTLDAKTGDILWDFTGLESSAGLLGGAAPAADSALVFPAFTSGEIYALRIENGAVAWSDNLASTLRLGGMSGLTDIKGLPVVDKGLVFAISYSGRIVAIDKQTGMRVWAKDIGGSETPWVAGNTVFVLSSDQTLVALARESGAIRWVTQMKRYEDVQKRKGAIQWAGPVLAGGRLILVGSGGRVAEIDPNDGKLTGQWSAGKDVRMAPVVAGGTLYLLAEDGSLLAYR